MSVVRPASSPAVTADALAHQRLGAFAGARGDMEPFPVALCLIAAILGAIAFVRIDLVGELYLVELLIIPLGVLSMIALGGGRVLRDPMFLIVVAAGFATLAGYVLSDLVVGTRSEQYLRGWARVMFTVTDVAFLTLLLAKDKRILLAFALGLGLGMAGFSIAEGLNLRAQWKFSLGPASTLILLPLCWMLPVVLRGPVIVGLGLLHVVLDFRSLGAVVMAVGIVMVARAGQPTRPLVFNRGLVIAMAAAALGVYAMFSILDVKREELAARWEISNSGRSLDYYVGIPAIMESPLVGHGSWAVSSALGQSVRDTLSKQVKTEDGRRQTAARSKYFPHSQIVQSWYEGGILGAAFFLVYLGLLLTTLSYVVRLRPVDYATPFVTYALTIALWNFFMSPWAGSHRMAIAMAVATIFTVRLERASSVLPKLATDAALGGRRQSSGLTRPVRPRP